MMVIQMPELEKEEGLVIWALCRLQSAISSPILGVRRSAIQKMKARDVSFRLLARRVRGRYEDRSNRQLSKWYQNWAGGSVQAVPTVICVWIPTERVFKKILQEH